MLYKTDPNVSLAAARDAAVDAFVLLHADASKCANHASQGTCTTDLGFGAGANSLARPPLARMEELRMLLQWHCSVGSVHCMAASSPSVPAYCIVGQSCARPVSLCAGAWTSKRGTSFCRPTA